MKKLFAFVRKPLASSPNASSNDSTSTPPVLPPLAQLHHSSLSSTASSAGSASGASVEFKSHSSLDKKKDNTSPKVTTFYTSVFKSFEAIQDHSDSSSEDEFEYASYLNFNKAFEENLPKPSESNPSLSPSSDKSQKGSLSPMSSSKLNSKGNSAHPEKHIVSPSISDIKTSNSIPSKHVEQNNTPSSSTHQRKAVFPSRKNNVPNSRNQHSPSSPSSKLRNVHSFISPDATAQLPSDSDSSMLKDEGISLARALKMISSKENKDGRRKEHKPSPANSKLSPSSNSEKLKTRKKAGG